MLDIWVCGNCQSINRERASRCYKCGGPRSGATGEGSTLRRDRAVVARLQSPVRNAAPLAFVTAAAIMALVGFEIATTAIEVQTAPQLAAAIDAIGRGAAIDRAPFDAFTDGLDRYAGPSIVSFFTAWVGLAAWSSLSIANLPGLGGGEAPIDSVRAFVYTLIPGYTFRHVPKMIQTLLYRLDPRSGGVIVAGVAWLGLVGAVIVSWAAGVYIDARLQLDAVNAESVAEYIQSVRGLLDSAVIVDVVTTGMIVVGALALVATIVRVERRARARDHEVEVAVGTG